MLISRIGCAFGIRVKWKIVSEFEYQRKWRNIEKMRESLFIFLSKCEKRREREKFRGENRIEIPTEGACRRTDTTTR